MLLYMDLCVSAINNFLFCDYNSILLTISCQLVSVLSGIDAISVK